MGGSRGVTQQQIEEAAAVVNDVRRARNMVFWKSRSFGAWPHDAMGYTLLGNAVLAVGQAVFPDWNGQEPADCLMPCLDGSRLYVQGGFDELFAASLLTSHKPDLAGRFTPDWSPMNAPVTPREWMAAENVYAEHMAVRYSQAVDKMTRIHSLLSTALADGSMVSAVRVGQEFRSLPPNWWIDEKINYKRFRESQADPDDPQTVHSPSNVLEVFFGDPRPLLYPGNAWIFVSKQSLAATLKGFAKSGSLNRGKHAARTDLADQPRYLPARASKTALTQALAKARSFLKRNKFTDLTREEAEELLRDLFPNSSRVQRREAYEEIPVGRRRPNRFLLTRNNELRDCRRFLVTET